MKIKARARAALHSAGVWFNALLLAAFPFADQIIQGVNDYLPSFAPYLPPNVYKVVGCTVVGINMLRSMQRAHQAAQAKEGTHG